jgi:hypothetical protein
MATLQTTTINGTTYLKLPVGNTAAQPASPTAGSMRVNSDTGALEIYTSASVWTNNNLVSFQYRNIITSHFVQGGYQNSSAWSNVNKTYSSTDTTVNLGSGAIERSFNYQWGACSKDYGYVFGAGNGHAINSNYVIAFNMRTETQASDISRSMADSRWTFGGLFQETQYAWINGGGASTKIEEYNMNTKTLVGTISATYLSGSIWGMSHENYGIFYDGINGANNFVFATRSISSRATQPSAYHQQKSVQSKGQYNYAGAQGSYNGGYTYLQTNMYTNSTSGSVNKPHGNCGEENYTMGQDWQYMIGTYDGNGQTNNSHKFYYATQTGFAGGASLQPKGIPGMSSASTMWCD